MVILDHGTATEFTQSIQQLQRDVHRELHMDSYDCWRVNRPAGWADSTAVEATERIESGTGRLYPNGPGGPQASDLIISIASPYRFRTTADAIIEPGHLLILNGQRLFRVDAVKPGQIGDVLMDVYLFELTSTPMPGTP